MTNGFSKPEAQESSDDKGKSSGILAALLPPAGTDQNCHEMKESRLHPNWVNSYFIFIVT